MIAIPKKVGAPKNASAEPTTHTKKAALTAKEIK
jgi:hypothetical protein